MARNSGKTESCAMTGRQLMRGGPNAIARCRSQLLSLLLCSVLTTCTNHAQSLPLSPDSVARLSKVGIHLDYGIVFTAVKNVDVGLITAGEGKLFYSAFPKTAKLRRDSIVMYDPKTKETKDLFEGEAFPQDALRISQLRYSRNRLYWTEIYTSAPRRITHTRICGIDLSTKSTFVIIERSATGSVPPFVPDIAVEGNTLCYATSSDIYEQSLDQITSSIVVYDLETKTVISTISSPDDIDIEPSIRNGILSFLKLTRGHFSIVIRDIAGQTESEITKDGISPLSQPTVLDQAVAYWDVRNRQLVEFSQKTKEASIVATDALNGLHSTGPWIGNNAVAWVVNNKDKTTGEVQFGAAQMAILSLETGQCAFVPLPKDSLTLSNVFPTSNGFCWNGFVSGPNGITSESDEFILGFM
jgi:hypothetical protein